MFSLVHLAPVLAPLSPCRTLTKMDTVSAPLDLTQVVSDHDDSFVEALETLPGKEDNQAMFEGEETENEKMDLGLGDVNHFSALQTPDRKRTYEVDSKTITRPKKTSPHSVTLPEVFSQENTTVASPQPFTHPVAISTPILMSTASSSSPAVGAPVTPTPTAAAATPARSVAAATPAAPGTYNKSSAPAPSRTARQQTMVVSSALTTSLRAAIEQEKASGLDEAAATRLEARILAIVQEKEREWNAKHDKLGQIMVAAKAEADDKMDQMEADVEALRAALIDANAAMAAGFPGRSSGPSSSSMPHLPPPAQLAAMSADKLAELARLKKEMENLEGENSKLHAQYNSLYETYSQQRSVIPNLKEKCEKLERAVEHEKGRFDKLKRHAEAKLEEATNENDALRTAMNREQRAHDDNTLSIRMRLKQREGEIEELQTSIVQKKKQITELKEICDELIRKADANASDIE